MAESKQTIIYYDMSTLNRVQVPDVGNIHESVAQIVAVLGDYPCNHADTHNYGHQFLIYDATVWLTLPNITLDVDITKPGTFTGTTHAESYIHEEQVGIYNTKETHLKGAIRMLKYIFPPGVFLDIQNGQGLMVGNTQGNHSPPPTHILWRRREINWDYKTRGIAQKSVWPGLVAPNLICSSTTRLDDLSIFKWGHPGQKAHLRSNQSVQPTCRPPPDSRWMKTEITGE